MIAPTATYVTDADGKRLGVLLDLATYERLIEELEDLEDIRDGRAALAALVTGEDEAIPFDQAMAELDARGQGS